MFLRIDQAIELSDSVCWLVLRYCLNSMVQNISVHYHPIYAYTAVQYYLYTAEVCLDRTCFCPILYQLFVWGDRILKEDKRCCYFCQELGYIELLSLLCRCGQEPGQYL